MLGDVHLTGSNVAQSSLLDHLAMLVGVSDAQGYSSPTGLGAGAPGSGLGHTVLLPVVFSTGESFQKDAQTDAHYRKL